MRLLYDILEKQKPKTKRVLSCRDCTRFNECRQAWNRHGQRGNFHKVCWCYTPRNKEEETRK